MIYYTGDLHGELNRILDWLDLVKETRHEQNYLIQLGDAGLNYYRDTRDYEKKALLQKKILQAAEYGVQLQILFVRGNHDCKPAYISSYQKVSMFQGTVWKEEKFPDLIFLKDGEFYQIDGKDILVLGGGYSRDFFQRLLTGEPYWYDEQMEEWEFDKVLEKLYDLDRNIYVCSHMLPASLAPVGLEKFCRKNRTEYWLQTCKQVLAGRITHWIAGHYHQNHRFAEEPFEMVYDRIRILE